MIVAIIGFNFLSKSDELNKLVKMKAKHAILHNYLDKKRMKDWEILVNQLFK